MAASTAAPTPPEPQGFSRWVPSLPTISLNTLNPFAGMNEESTKPASAADPAKQQPQDASKSSSVNKRSFLSATSLFSTSTNSPEPASRDASPARSTATTMFAEPDTRGTSEDGDSREGSIEESQRRSSKKSNKPKTRFSVCHAPPAGTVKQKLHRRPRSLLQLHRLSGNARPVPAFEVIPSANFNVRLTRAVTKVFKAKHGLCLNDLVVLRAEKYASVDDEQEEEQAAQDVIGLICAGRKQDEGMAKEGKAKICMTSGAEWEAYPLLNGGYEFFSTDEHGLGLTVRWVPKRNKEGSKAAKDGSKRFNFSTISPNSRRHPVIAGLSKTALEVNDTYRMPDASAATPMSTPKQSSTSALAEAMDEEAGGNQQCETDAALREIIAMTAIWVSFKEGWSPTFKYDDSKDAMQRVGSMSAQNSPSKSIGSPLTTPPGSPAQVPQLEKRASIKSVGSSILRKGSLLSKGNRASQVSVPEEDIRETALGRSESVKKTGPARGDSTSTVLVHRAASNRRKNNQATWRPDLLSAQNQLNETSREDLNNTPPRASTQRNEQWDSPATTPQRRQSLVAEPLIPASPNDVDSPEGPGTPTPVGVRREQPAPPIRETRRPTSPEKPGKRVSDATTETTEASVRQPSVGQKATSRKSKTTSSKTKKRGGWRRLLCGSGHHDI